MEITLADLDNAASRIMSAVNAEYTPAMDTSPVWYGKNRMLIKANSCAMTLSEAQYILDDNLIIMKHPSRPEKLMSMKDVLTQIASKRSKRERNLNTDLVGITLVTLLIVTYYNEEEKEKLLKIISTKLGNAWLGFCGRFRIHWNNVSRFDHMATYSKYPYLCPAGMERLFYLPDVPPMIASAKSKEKAEILKILLAYSKEFYPCSLSEEYENLIGQLFGESYHPTIGNALCDFMQDCFNLIDCHYDYEKALMIIPVLRVCVKDPLGLRLLYSVITDKEDDSWC